VVFATDGGEEGSVRSRRKRERTKTRRGDEEGMGRAIIEKAIFALNISMLRSKGDWFWR